MPNLCRHCRFFGGDQLAPGEIGFCESTATDNPYGRAMRSGSAAACRWFVRYTAPHSELAVPK